MANAELEKIKEEFYKKRTQYDKLVKKDKEKEKKNQYGKNEEEKSFWDDDFFNIPDDPQMIPLFDKEEKKKEEKQKKEKGKFDENEYELNVCKEILKEVELMKGMNYKIDWQSQVDYVKFGSPYDLNLDSIKFPLLPINIMREELNSNFFTTDYTTNEIIKPPNVNFDSPSVYMNSAVNRLKMLRKKRYMQEEINNNRVIEELEYDVDIPEEIVDQINELARNYVTQEEYYAERNKILRTIGRSCYYFVFDEEDRFWGDLSKNKSFKNADIRDKYMTKWIREVCEEIWYWVMNDPSFKFLVEDKNGNVKGNVSGNGNGNEEIKVMLPQLFCCQPISSIVDKERKSWEKYGYNIVCCINRRLYRCLDKMKAYYKYFEIENEQVKSSSGLFCIGEDCIRPFFNAFFNKHITYADSVSFAVANFVGWIRDFYWDMRSEDEGDVENVGNVEEDVKKGNRDKKNVKKRDGKGDKKEDKKIDYKTTKIDYKTFLSMGLWNEDDEDEDDENDEI